MGSVHAHGLAANPNADLVWAVDLDLSRAESLVEKIGGRATASMDEALADPGVDAVLIALPTSLHRMATEAAAGAGKHVFCEKPIARTAEDGAAMAQACRAAGVTLMIGHVVRFYPEFARIREIIEAGTLGRIAMVRTFRVNPPVQERSPWFADVEKNGGLVLDLMVHDLDTLCWYFGDVERLYAHGLTYTEHQPRRDYAVASVRFRNGVIAHLECSWAHSTFRTGIEVAGQYGLLRHTSEEGATLTLERTTATTDARDRPARTLMRPSRQTPHQVELQHFIDCLRTGEPVLIDGEAGVRAITLANAVLDSMRTRQPISFDTDGTAKQALMT
jgi:predicted dehydrogenase